MTPKQSTARLTLYILIAMGTSASAGVPTIDFTNWRESAGFALSVIMTGLVTARSYIDQTPTQVEPEKPPFRANCPPLYQEISRSDKIP